MEDLNKNQIVLLTLLVSFVTSIATGIITVSLLQEAPLEVTRNINRIVEKTIETVAPSVNSSSSDKKEITTVVVREEDQVLASIDKNVKSIVRIYEKDSVTLLSSLYGIGLVVNKDGLIATDRKSINEVSVYSAVMNDRVEFKLVPQGISKDTKFILFKVVIPEKAPPYTFIPASLSDTQPKLGQTLISLGGKDTNAVSVGRVTSLDMKESGTGTSTIKYLANISVDISTKDLVSGNPLFNLSGDIVGIKIGDDESKNFVPIALFKKELTVLQESVKTQ